MARSSTGYIWFVLIGVTFAVVLGYAYTFQKSKVNKKKIDDINNKWRDYLKKYGPTGGSNRIKQDVLLQAINQQNYRLTHDRDKYKKSLEMQFPDYVSGVYSLGPTQSPGGYFLDWLVRIRDELREYTRQRGVDMKSIGDHLIFSEKDVSLIQIREDEAEQLLQFLSIAEMIVKRAANAKAKQEQYEMTYLKDKPQLQLAYMKFLSLSYKPPRRTAPVKLTPNPAHAKWLEKRKKFGGNKRYVGQEPPKFIGYYYEPFIVEFPIELEMICDDKSLIRFLASLQETGEILTIQRIQIMSPGIDLVPGGDRNKPDALKGAHEQHIYVKLAAAGQIFKPKPPDEKWEPPKILGSEIAGVLASSKPKKKEEFKDPKGY